MEPRDRVEAAFEDAEVERRASPSSIEELVASVFDFVAALYGIPRDELPDAR